MTAEHSHDHDGHDHHGHGHDHHHVDPSNINRAFLIGAALNLVIVILQVVYGWLTGSLALLADAGHNLSDVLAILLAWGANYLSGRSPTKRFTYGFRRASILTAFLNATILLIAMGAISLEAIQRFSAPREVPGMPLIIVAAIAIFINAGTAFLFAAGAKEDLNMRGVFMHLASDALTSVGVVLVGLGMLFTGWTWLDPLISLAIVVLIVWGTWSLFLESLRLSLDAVPGNIEPTEVERTLRNLAGVERVHDLHIWAMSTSQVALTAHLVMPEGTPGDQFLQATTATLAKQFKIQHATLQIETGDQDCELQPTNHV